MASLRDDISRGWQLPRLELWAHLSTRHGSARRLVCAAGCGAPRQKVRRRHGRLACHACTPLVAGRRRKCTWGATGRRRRESPRRAASATVVESGAAQETVGRAEAAWVVVCRSSSWKLDMGHVRRRVRSSLSLFRCSILPGILQAQLHPGAISNHSLNYHLHHQFYCS